MKQIVTIASVCLLMQACAGLPAKKNKNTMVDLPKNASVAVIKKDREDKYAQRLYELNQRNPVQDAQQAISAGNYHLLGYQSGRGGSNKAPGLTGQQAASASCGFRRLDGFGDTIYGESHLRYRVASRKYATQFNRAMYPYCQQGRGQTTTKYLKTR